VAAGPARANGAFPDSTQIVLPRDRPDEIIAGTNFGLLVSRDAGATWSWICEEAIGPMTVLYQVGPPPSNTMFALAQTGLLSSNDRACTWSATPPPLDDNGLRDVFPDATDARRVFALTASALFESRDGGKSFGPSLYEPGGGVELSGVEAAASDRQVVYVTRYVNEGGNGITASIARSTDGGHSFRVFELRPMIGEGFVRLAAVDPEDPRRLYLRMTTGRGDRLVISDDGGESARVALSFAGAIAGFLRRPDGTLLVTTASEGAFASRDRGATFVPWPAAPHLRGLGERDGVLYGAADNFSDGFIVGASRDGGETWKPLLRLDHLCGVLTCSEHVTRVCAEPWQRLQTLFAIEGGACRAQGPGDASAGERGSASGCACRTGARSRGPGAWWLALALALRTRRRLARRAVEDRPRQRAAGPQVAADAEDGARA
jgi:hypothetical protein